MKFHKGYFTLKPLRLIFKRKNSVKNSAERQFFVPASSNSLFRLNFERNGLSEPLRDRRFLRLNYTGYFEMAQKVIDGDSDTCQHLHLIMGCQNSPKGRTIHWLTFQLEKKGNGEKLRFLMLFWILFQSFANDFYFGVDCRYFEFIKKLAKKG